jgi:hypothetical protein
MLRSFLMILVVCLFASMPCVGAPTLSITPRQGLIDEPLMIEVDGLAAGQTFVIRAVMRVDAQTTLASHGLFPSRRSRSCGFSILCRASYVS